jgi:hypothetical protein
MKASCWQLDPVRICNSRGGEQFASDFAAARLQDVRMGWSLVRARGGLDPRCGCIAALSEPTPRTTFQLGGIHGSTVK